MPGMAILSSLRHVWVFADFVMGKQPLMVHVVYLKNALCTGKRGT